MKKFTLVFFVLFFSIALYSQKEANIWYFGNYGALDFATGTPSVITPGAMMPSEGCSIMSDATGNLLFYTDGKDVWNKNHVIMTNGTGLDGGPSSTQAALIVPMPGSATIYYIFTTDDSGNGNGLKYSTVDISLSGGLGSVVTKNSPLISPVAEKLTAVKDPYNNRYWVVVHDFGNNGFFAYALTATGVQPPVVSYVGTPHAGIMQNSYGQMKFNICGNKLAAAIGYQNKWELLDFNTNSGVVSNPLTFSEPDHVYGIEFSADGSKLYLSTYDNFSPYTLSQFDLTSNVQAVIAASQTTLSSTSSIYGMQLATDSKIYVCKSFNQYLGVIDFPNIGGVGCSYNDLGVDLDPMFMGNTSALSLPGFVQSYFFPVNGSCPIPTSITETKTEIQQGIYPNPSANEFSYTLNDPCTVSIYSASGQLMQEFKITEEQKITFGKDYTSGIYLVRFHNASGERTTRVVKE